MLSCADSGQSIQQIGHRYDLKPKMAKSIILMLFLPGVGFRGFGLTGSKFSQPRMVQAQQILLQRTQNTYKAKHDLVQGSRQG